MLSGETAVGKYPVVAVQTMARIAHEAEKLFDYEGWSERMAPSRDEQSARNGPPDTTTITDLICRSADKIGDELGASAIITVTESGLSARLVAKYRPRSSLIAITDRLTTQRVLAVTWGVHALLLEQSGDSLITLAEAEQLALRLGLVSPGDLLVFTGGLPQHLPGRTNLLKVQVAGEK
jgi:pyruvate kinase